MDGSGDPHGSYGYAQGLWELAVLRGEKLTYDTGITDDVIGNLNETEVEALLARIEALPADSDRTEG